FRNMNAPIVIDQSNIFVEGRENSRRGAFTREKMERFPFEFANRKISGRRDGLWRFGFEYQHATRHMSGRRDQEIALPSVMKQKLFHFDGALEGVARIALGKHVDLRHTPAD